VNGATHHGWPARQEEDAIHAPRLARMAVGAGVVFAIAVVVAGALLAVVTGRVRPASSSRQATAEISGIEQTPTPETRAGLDLREAQRRALDRWAWIDRDAGLVAMPIERAIDRVVQEAAR
jgi:hypothetical protein